MKEKGLSEQLINQSNLVLDAIEGKIDVIDSVKNTGFHNPSESELVVNRIVLLHSKVSTKEFKDKNKMINKKDAKTKDASD